MASQPCYNAVTMVWQWCYLDVQRFEVLVLHEWKRLQIDGCPARVPGPLERA
jgi:hypothetical protein